MTINYRVIPCGESRSFPTAHNLTENSNDKGEVLILIGEQAGAALSEIPDRDRYGAVLIELGSECLGVHTGESRGLEGSNLLGFNRFRLGDAEPSNLVELVRQPATQETAIEAARSVLEAVGFSVAVCGDFPGRIINRLVRPYYNAALRRLDEGLASADDMDLTLRLGLGYPEGPIALLEETGLALHFEVSRDLHEALGEEPYAPARRSRVAWERRGK